MAGRQIANLQVLRGVAALLVVLYHLQPVLNRGYVLTLDHHVGVFGVDIFFIISGFVMVISNPRPNPAITGLFLFHRFFRIVPMYWLATAAIVVCFVVGFRPVGLHHLNLKIIAQSAAFVPSSFPDGRHDLILTVGWTLMYELFFYAVLALTFPMRSIQRSVAALAFLFLVLTLFGQFASPLSYLLDFFTAPIILEFLYGALLALAYARYSDVAPRWLGPAGLLLLSLGFAIVLSLDIAGIAVPNKHGSRFILLGLPALLVVAGTLAMERGDWKAEHPLLLELGAASYVLYLLHPLILQASVKLVRPIIPTSPWLAGVGAIIACVVAAVAVHRSIEKPLLSWSKLWLRRRLRSGAPQPATIAVYPAE